MATLINIGNNIKVNPKFISYFEGLEIVLANKHRFTVSADVIELVKAYVENRNTGALHYKGKVSSVSNLPSTGNIDGDMYLVTGEDKYYAWNGTSWDDTPTIVNISALEASLSSEVSRAQAKEAELQEAIDDQNDEIEDFKDAITDQVNNYQPVVIEGDVTNAADEEDLTSENGLLKIKNRSALNGMGYVILRRGSSFASQVTLPNTIYEIRYNFDLGGAEVTIPENCVLQFEGGKLSNGTISLSNSKIVAYDCQIFDNISFSSVSTLEGRPEWFGAKADGETNDTSAIQNAINSFEKTILAGYRYLITSVDVEPIANPWGRRVINNSTIISTGEGIRLNSHCKLSGGRINVRANSVGITIGRTDNVEAHNRISVEDVTIIGNDKSTETYGVKCIATEGNHYNAFCHIDNVMIYGCRHGFYGNVRSSYININIEGCYDNFNLTNGSLNSIILTGNASTSIPEYPDFAIVTGELNNVNFKVYDVGSGAFQKNPIKFIGVDNTLTGYDRNVKNSDVSNFSSSPYFKGGSFKVEAPIFSCSIVNILNPDVKKDYLEKNAFRSDLDERCYVELYKADRTQDAYVEFNFGPVWQFMAVNLLCATANDSFEKIEVRGDTNAEPFISVSNNYEKPFINVHVNTYKEFFNYDSNFSRQVYPNLCIRCYVSKNGKTRFLGGEFFAHSARTMPKKGTTVQRPTLSSNEAGYQFYDTTLNQLLVWDGTSWVPATDNRPATLTSMGYKVLDKDKTFKSQVEGSANQNAIFEIRDQFDLDGTTVLIPAGCTLKFAGGKVENGVLGFGEGCRITSLYSGIFSGLRFSNTGAQLCSDFRLSWYAFDDTCTRDNFLFLYTLYPMFSTSDYNVVWDIPEVHVLYSNPIVLGYGKCHDFNNTIIHAQATADKKYLFKIERPLPAASEYTKIADAVQDVAFSNTTGMLIVKDNTKLYQRPGYQQNYYRADVLLVQDNDLVNQPIMDYDNDADTSASIFLLSAEEAGTEFRNVVFDRSTSEYIASLVAFSACYRPVVRNVVVKTAPLEAYGEEGVIKFEYSFGPQLKDCSIVGNYGSTLGSGQFSYNICLYYCSNALLEGIESNATWHSFGCRGVNGIVIKDSIIDQFDSHTYGKDFSFYDCIFHSKHTANPFVGYSKFVNCTFNEMQVATELDSEIASFPYKRIYENCTFTDCGNLIHVSKINTVANLRSMLQAIEYPGLIVNNCKMIYKNVSPASLYYVNSNNFDALANAQPALIEINRLEIVGSFQSSTNINIVSSATIKADIVAENIFSISTGCENLKMPTSLLAGSKIRFTNVRLGTFEQGTTRPSLGSRNVGYAFFDTTLGKPVYWTGSKWVDATGADLT